MWVKLESMGDWTAQCAGCGDDLDHPVYQFNFSQYIDNELQSQLQSA